MTIFFFRDRIIDFYKPVNYMCTVNRTSVLSVSHFDYVYYCLLFRCEYSYLFYSRNHYFVFYLYLIIAVLLLVQYYYFARQLNHLSSYIYSLYSPRYPIYFHN